MKNSTFANLNRSEPIKSKQLWKVDKKYLIIIDKSIIEKLGITENTIVFFEQEILQDNSILMRIKKF